MKKIHIAICDDENMDLVQTLDLLKEYDKGERLHISAFFSAGELLSSSPDTIDIVLLDIEMEPPSGLEAAKQLMTLAEPPVIIFITKNGAYAPKGYGLAIRYVQKPIDKTEFYEALDTAICEATAHRMTFKTGDTTYTVRLSELLYIEILGHYATVHSTVGEYRFRSTLQEIASNLPKLYFASHHKSYIVNLEKIQSATSYALYLCDGTRIPISRGRASEFNKAFYRFLGR